MNILPCLDAQVQSVLHFFEPLGCLIKSRRKDFGWSKDLLRHRDLTEVWREDQLFHDLPDNELCSAVAMTHACLGHRLRDYI